MAASLLAGHGGEGELRRRVPSSAARERWFVVFFTDGCDSMFSFFGWPWRLPEASVAVSLGWRSSVGSFSPVVPGPRSVPCAGPAGSARGVVVVLVVLAEVKDLIAFLWFFRVVFGKLQGCSVITFFLRMFMQLLPIHDNESSLRVFPPLSVQKKVEPPSLLFFSEPVRNLNRFLV
jgi:hypothetical protein